MLPRVNVTERLSPHVLLPSCICNLSAIVVIAPTWAPRHFVYLYLSTLVFTRLPLFLLFWGLPCARWRKVAPADNGQAMALLSTRCTQTNASPASTETLQRVLTKNSGPQIHVYRYRYNLWSNIQPHQPTYWQQIDTAAQNYQLAITNLTLQVTIYVW